MNSRIAIAVSLLGAAILGALAVAYAGAKNANSDSAEPVQKEAIEKVVHDYLMAHPEVVVDALNTYADRQRTDAANRSKEAAKKNLTELLNPKDGYIAGADKAKADVAVIEFFDYHCAFCKRAAGYVQDLTHDDPSVEVVFREYPILRQESEYASQVALATRAQGKYTDLHFAMLDATGVLTKERVKDIAESKGVDFNAVEQTLKNPSITKAIDATHRIAEDMQIDGTPTFVVASTDGSFVDVVPGYDEDGLKTAIANAKKAAKKNG